MKMIVSILFLSLLFGCSVQGSIYKCDCKLKKKHPNAIIVVRDNFLYVLEKDGVLIRYSCDTWTSELSIPDYLIDNKGE